MIHMAVIHDQKREDRQTLFVQEMAGQGINHMDVAVIPAVKLSKKPVENICSAHKSAVNWAMYHGYEEVLIMEDDVMFTHPLSMQRFLEHRKYLPKDWMIYLAGVYDMELTGVSNNLGRILEFSGLHCYIVRDLFYRDILSAPPTINLDKWISGKKLRNQHGYVCYPMVALQYDGLSDNVGRVTEYNRHIKNRYKIWSGEP